MRLLVRKCPHFLFNGGAVAGPHSKAMLIIAKNRCVLVVINDYLVGSLIGLRQVAGNFLLLHLEVVEGVLEAEPGYFFVALVRFQV